MPALLFVLTFIAIFPLRVEYNYLEKIFLATPPPSCVWRHLVNISTIPYYNSRWINKNNHAWSGNLPLDIWCWYKYSTNQASCVKLPAIQYDNTHLYYAFYCHNIWMPMLRWHAAHQCGLRILDGVEGAWRPILQHCYGVKYMWTLLATSCPWPLKWWLWQRATHEYNLVHQ